MSSFTPSPGQLAYAAARNDALATLGLPDSDPRRAAALAALEAAHDLMDQEHLEWERAARDEFFLTEDRGEATEIITEEADNGEF